MATEVIKIVDPDNGSGTNYTSLSAWEAGEQGDLTGARDEIAVAKCRCTGGTADSAVTIDGFTTSTTQYIQIWTDPSESYRHDGKWKADAYRLQATGDDSVIVIGDNNVRLIGLQLKELNADYDRRCITIIPTGTLDTGVIIDKCILTGTAKSWGVYTATDDSIITIKNSIFRIPKF